MLLDRRSFLFSAASFGLVAAADEPPKLFTKAKADFDDHLTVLLADIHVGAQADAPTFPAKRLEKEIARILKLDPLPRRAVVFGDLAYRRGFAGDYVKSAPLLKQLTDAGIELTIGMGNHDRRSAFLETYPEHAKRTRVPGRLVSVVSGPDADILMLDTLQGADNRDVLDAGPSEGALDEAQQEFLAKELPAWPRPVFVGAHHGFGGLTVKGNPLVDLLCASDNVVGWLNGHYHRWLTEWTKCKKGPAWMRARVLRSVRLPSTSYSGDVGFALLRTAPGDFRVELCQDDFQVYVGGKIPRLAKRTAVNDAIVRDHAGAVCRFVPYPKR